MLPGTYLEYTAQNFQDEVVVKSFYANASTIAQFL